MARDRELARIEQLLTSARGGRSGVLVLVGEPGVGKTWLCDRTAERADGFRILRTRGIEPEQHLGYAGLLDVVSPLLPGALDALAPAPRGRAARSAAPRRDGCAGSARRRGRPASTCSPRPLIPRLRS